MHFLALSKLMLTRAVRSWRLIQLERGTANIGKQHILQELFTDALAKHAQLPKEKEKREKEKEKRGKEQKKGKRKEKEK